MNRSTFIQLFTIIVITVSIHSVPSIEKEVVQSSLSSITPIYAGSLELDDKILRLNTCIFKNITLPFSKEYYQSNNINVLASISETSMNQHFAYQIKYQIICSSNCIIDFALSRFTQLVSQNFKYHLVIDFVVVNNLKISSFNMTSNKIDFNVESLLCVDSNEKIDDFQIILIPNGFNNITLTGYIKYLPMPTSNKIIIQYQNQNKEEWIINRNFILYKILLIPKQQASLIKPQCKVESSFTGFLSTKQPQISINLHSTQQAVSYKQFKLPFHCNSQFKDERKPIQNLEKPFRISQSNISASYFVPIGLFLIAELVYLLYRKKYAGSQHKNQPKLPQMLISFQASQIATIQQEKQTQPRMQSEPDSEKVVQLQ